VSPPAIAIAVGLLRRRAPVIPATMLEQFGSSLVMSHEFISNYVPTEASIDPDLTTYAPVGVAVVLDATVTYLGASSYRITEDGSTGLHTAVGSTVNATDGRAIRIHAKVKDGTRGFIVLSISATEYSIWNLSTLAVTTDFGTFVGSPGVALGDGWIQFEALATPANAGLASACLSSDGTLTSYAGDGVSYANVIDLEISQTRFAGAADQSLNLHDLVQATPSQQPTVGATAQAENAVAVFDGVDDTAPADVGTGWDGSTSLTVGFLFDNRSLTSGGLLLGAQTGLTLFASNATSSAGWYSSGTQAVSPSTLGWQILIYRLNGATSTGYLYRATSSGLALLGDALYNPKTIAGSVSVGSNYNGMLPAPIDLAADMILNRLATPAELEGIVKRFRYVLAQIKEVLAP
jgi:hypothetical protein